MDPNQSSTLSVESVVAFGYKIREQFPTHRIVFVSGNFNIIHPGHLRLVNFAKSCGDRLVMGIYGDSHPGVLLQAEHRVEAARALAAVDEVLLLNENHLGPLLEALKPEFVVKGKEFEHALNPEAEVLAAYGGRLLFASGESSFSSVDLLNREIRAQSTVGFRVEHEFIDRHGLDHKAIRARIEVFSSKKVLVIGELILDEYVSCEPIGMSQEDPTIVVTPIATNTFVGGAGIVAGHMAGLGARVSFITVTGDDEASRSCGALLKRYNVETQLCIDPSRPTIRKQRFRAGNKTLLRVNHLRSHDIDAPLIGKFLELVEGALPLVDLVVFSDFNYGCLPDDLVQSVTGQCQKLGIPYVADSQSSSQVGDVSRFKDALLISATEREARLAVNDFKSGLQHVANRLMRQCRPEGLFVKLGSEGLILLDGTKGFKTSALGALNGHPVDTAGAGDALLSASALALISGAGLAESAYIGSFAAAVQVGRLGNTPLLKKELERSIAALGQIQPIDSVL